MPRYKLTIEYDGTGLAGWQAQKDAYSVQAAMRKVHVILGGNESHELVASGRTDAGVHALGQVVHLDLPEEMDAFRVKEAFNFYLRQDDELPNQGQVVVLDAEQVASDFSARFNAVRRHYLYRVINRRSHLALERNRAWNVHEELDVARMQDASTVLIGQHDFTSFRASECQAKSPLKTIEKIEITRAGELIEFRLSARSFLHHQVRNIVGTLRLIGNGKWDKAALTKALEAKNRASAGETAPPGGLYLVKIDY